MPCPICLSSDIITHRILYDDRFGFDGHFTLLKCNFCDHKFLDNITDDFLNLIYENYYYRNNLDSTDIKKIKEKNNLFLWLTGNYYFAYRWVPKDVRVLDIGCGFGEALIYHKNRGCEVFGVETGGESIKNLSDKYGLNIKIGFFDPNLYPENYFDYITMDQVIEHIKNPLETLKGIRRILKPTGKVIISTPNPDGWGAAVFKNKYWNWHIPYHINQFSILSMKVLAKRANLILKKSKTITLSNWILGQIVHYLNFPKIGVPSKIYTNIYNKKNINIDLIYKIYDYMGITHLIPRLLDVFGLGNSFIFILTK